MISLKAGEKVHIGSEVTVSVVDVQDGQVRLRIKSPNSTSIRTKAAPSRTRGDLRRELETLQKIALENRGSGQGSATDEFIRSRRLEEQ